MNNHEENFDSLDGKQEGNVDTKNSNKTVWIVVALMTLLCAVVGVLSSVLTGYFMRRGTPLPAIVIEGNEQNVTAIVKVRRPAIVEIESGGLRGSGVSMKYEKGKVYVLTNRHVLNNLDDIKVRFYNEEVGYFADVVGYSTMYDIAVVSVVRDEVYVLDTPEIFDRALEYSAGDGTVAIGNAMGLGISVYDGIISKTSDIITSGGVNVPVLRTTSAINAGMSGGALFDMEGRFLGLNTYRMSTMGETDEDKQDPANDVEDTGFVTPVSIVYDIYTQILEADNGGELTGILSITYYGSSTSTSVGGMTVTVAGSPAKVFSAEFRNGKLVVSGLDSASPIEGLRVDDVITQIGDTELYPDGKERFDLCRTVGELLRYRRNVTIGEKLTLKLRRGDETDTVEIEGYYRYVR